MQYKVALFVGRFQPFHNGHLYALKKCLEIAESVVVGIGSSQESGTADNPWDYETRKEMIERLEGESLPAQAGLQVTKIVPIADTPTDEEWVAEVERSAGKFDVVVSNNEWTLKVMREAGYTTFETGLYNRDELEGVKIRAMVRVGDTRWRLRVPREVRDYLEMVI